jgi:hypothetical protein
MSVINISKKSNEDDWGFYVDIENTNFNNYDNYKIMREKYGLNNNNFYSTIDCISEDYSYYLNQQQEIETIENNFKVNKKRYIFKICSTTFIVLIITYVVFYVV